ncbi:MAG: beta-ketoacyl-[acyl-carrier-protein] synthase family protein [Blautia sp.]|jgi:3-oxoacyl-[acyl-carrier-protein] synthase II
MNNNRRVVITGMGVIASNGTGKDAFMAACRDGILGIRDCTLFSTEKLRTGKFGQVEEELVYAPASYEEENRMESLMKIALSETYKDASYSAKLMSQKGSRACICLGTLLGTTGDMVAYVHQEAAGEDTRGWLEHSMDFSSWLRQKSGVKGGIYVDSAACASGTTAAGMAYDFIKEGIYDVALTGGADPLLTVNAYGFHALQALSTGICNPFDETRDGINIGEGAAFFLIEDLESAKKRGADIYGEILGYGLNNDAYHITSPDPEGAGAVTSMESAIREGGICPEQVDAINAHGTGTLVNDSMELAAIERVFQGSSQPLRVNSTKALIGHCMGASGAVELAAVLLEMQEGISFPMPRLTKPMDGAKRLELLKETQERNARYVLSNSFAFAGNTASILIGAYEDE